jgi:hypothetical protein
MNRRLGGINHLTANIFLTTLRHWIWDLLYLARKDKSQFGEQGLIEKYMWSDYKAKSLWIFS